MASYRKTIFVTLVVTSKKMFDQFDKVRLGKAGQVCFGNGNRGSFPGTVTGPPLVTAGQYIENRLSEDRVADAQHWRTLGGYDVRKDTGSQRQASMAR